jgi:hypothetical protein
MKRLTALLLALSLLLALTSIVNAPIVKAAPLNPCQPLSHHIYLPIVGQTMIISRFGSAYDTAYPFPTLKGADDYQTQRPASVGQVGGMAGAFDFWGAQGNPIAAQVVTKKFELAAPFVYAGAGTIWTDVLIGIDMPSYYLIRGIGTHFLTDFSVGDLVRFTFEGDVCTYAITQIDSDTVMRAGYAIGEVVDVPIGSAVSYEIVKTTGTYSNVERGIDALKLATLNAGESKLWALRRDGTHLWAWAKCNRGRWPEDYNTKLHLPVELEFYCREGVWYGETQGTSGNITQATSSPYVLTSNGVLPANAVFTITPSGGALASVTVTNTTNGYTFTYTGTVNSGQALVVDAGAWSVKNNGVGAYAGFAYGAGQQNWMRLAPGANAFTISKTGPATGWTATLTWFDTFIP